MEGKVWRVVVVVVVGERGGEDEEDWGMFEDGEFGSISVENGSISGENLKKIKYDNEIMKRKDGDKQIATTTQTCPFSAIAT